MSLQQFAEDYDPHGSLNEQYFDAYADLGVHRVMLADAARMSFYHQAITCDKAVEGRVVVDVGSGTGILSMWAARAGAKHVFSIEASSLSFIQGRVIEDNDLSEKITLLSDTVENVIARGIADFIEKHEAALRGSGVSVIVSEWMGFYLLHEGMLPSVIRARNFFQEVNTRLGISCKVEMIPDHATIRVAPMNSASYYEASYKQFWGAVGGIDLSRYGRIEFETRLENSNPLIDAVPSACLLHEGVSLAELELTTVSEEAVASLRRDAHFDFRNSAAFLRHLRDAASGRAGVVVVDGFTLWFDVSFRGCLLNTSPCTPPTHWKQTTVLLPPTVREEQLVAFSSSDVALDVEVRLEATDASLRCYRIEFELK